MLQPPPLLEGFLERIFVFLHSICSFARNRLAAAAAAQLFGAAADTASATTDVSDPVSTLHPYLSWFKKRARTSKNDITCLWLER